MRMRVLSVLVVLVVSLAVAQDNGMNRQPMARDNKMSMMKMDKDMAMKMIAGWPDDSKKAAKMTIEKYGAPQEATESMLMWKNNGPWLKTVVFKESVEHNFPVKHTDMMQQWIAYKVPWDKFDEVASFDGSVVPERTTGLVSSRCDKEGANLLGMNLVNDIVGGKMNVNEARQYYAKAIDGFMKENKMDPYMQRVMFGKMSMSSTADPDKPMTDMQTSQVKR